MTRTFAFLLGATLLGGGVAASGCATSTTDVAEVQATSAQSSSSSGGEGGEGGTAIPTSATVGAGGAGGEMSPGLPLGAECLSDEQCQTGLCETVLLNTSIQVCVSECLTGDDCPPGDQFFCEPIAPGAIDGYCIPRSPAHCLSCTEDADCGYLSEACIRAPGDKDFACHVDCSVDGENACPAEYSCEEIDVDGTLRKLCRPPIATCLDAIGGYCDRVAVPQICSRVNDAGACIGQRECLTQAARFNSCTAGAPQCKTTCTEQDPAGCELIHCPETISTVDHCSACGIACAGKDATTANVTCNSGDCTFTCKGENYDADNSKGNGCEVVDSPLGNHVQGAPAFVANLPCHDDDSNPNISGRLYSDKQVHENPAIDGFNPATGAAPDWYRVRATGGTFCLNEVDVDLQVNGSAFPSCYRLTVKTTDIDKTCQTNAAGNCGINEGSGSYDGGTDILFRIEKTCNSASTEAVTYTVTGHL